MTYENDFEKFGELMIIWGELSAGSEEMRRPSPQKIELYFQALKDLSLETIIENSANYFRTGKWFPTIADIRQEDNGEVQALIAYRDIEELVDNFYDPLLGSCCFEAMCLRLKKQKKSNLLPLLLRWGPEIYNRSNPTATRAQFIKEFTALQINNGQKKVLPAREFKQISEIILKPVLP